MRAIFKGLGKAMMVILGVGLIIMNIVLDGIGLIIGAIIQQ